MIRMDFVALQKDDRSQSEDLSQQHARINIRQARDPNYLDKCGQSASAAMKIPSARLYIFRDLLINNQSKGVACYWTCHS